MSTASNLWLEDKVLSIKAAFCGAFVSTAKQRELLEKLLKVRLQRVRPGHPSLADVYQDLAHSYLGHHMGDLAHADDLAQEAINILEFNKLTTNRRGGKNFRMGNLVHLRCLIHQRMNNGHEALRLGEEALTIYNNNNNLVSHQRSSVMHTLVQLHRAVGSQDRARRLEIEVRAVDQVLMSSSARGRMWM